MSESDRLFFVEQMDDTVQRIGEMFALLAEDIAWMKPKVAKIDGIEQDVKMLKHALTKTNKDLANNNRRLDVVTTDLANNKQELNAVAKDFVNNNRRLDIITENLIDNNQRLDVLSQDLGVTNRKLEKITGELAATNQEMRRQNDKYDRRLLKLERA